MRTVFVYDEEFHSEDGWIRREYHVLNRPIKVGDMVEISLDTEINPISRLHEVPTLEEMEAVRRLIKQRIKERKLRERKEAKYGIGERAYQSACNMLENAHLYEDHEDPYEKILERIQEPPVRRGIVIGINETGSTVTYNIRFGVGTMRFKQGLVFGPITRIYERPIGQVVK